MGALFALLVVVERLCRLESCCGGSDEPRTAWTVYPEPFIMLRKGLSASAEMSCGCLNLESRFHLFFQ